MDGARAFAIQRFAKDLLESIDNFDRALLAVPPEKISAAQTEENKDLLELVDGLKMTQNILMNTLQKHGLERFDPSEKVEGKPQKFDPNLHEATFMSKAEGMEDGDVMYTQSKGFRLNGRVLRVSPVGSCDDVSILLTYLSLLRLPRSASSRTTKSLLSHLVHFPNLFFSLYHISYVTITIGIGTRICTRIAAGCWFREKLLFLDICLSLGSV